MNRLGTLPLRHYRVLYVDPPWAFENYSDRGGGRGADAHYDTLSIEELKAMPVQQHVAKDCVLFLWIVNTHLTEALELIKAWGFEYKTKGFIWIKTNKHSRFDPDCNPLVPLPVSDRDLHIGNGFHTRANPEDVLLASVGHPQRLRKDVRQLVFAPVREHSRKFDARLSDSDEVLCVSETPMFDAARVLLRTNRAHSSDLLVMRHAGSPHDALRATVGAAAELHDRGNGLPPPSPQICPASGDGSAQDRAGRGGRYPSPGNRNAAPRRPLP